MVYGSVSRRSCEVSGATMNQRIEMTDCPRCNGKWERGYGGGYACYSCSLVFLPYIREILLSLGDPNTYEGTPLFYWSLSDHRCGFMPNGDDGSRTIDIQWVPITTSKEQLLKLLVLL